RTDVGIFLAHVVVGIGVVRPVKARLQTIVSFVYRSFPNKGCKRRALGGAFSAQVNYFLADQRAAWSSSETEVSEMHRKSRSRCVVRIVPDPHTNFVFRVPLE